jgi:hypothetical protein
MNTRKVCFATCDVKGAVVLEKSRGGSLNFERTRFARLRTLLQFFQRTIRSAISTIRIRNIMWA